MPGKAVCCLLNNQQHKIIPFPVFGSPAERAQYDGCEACDLLWEGREARMLTATVNHKNISSPVIRAPAGCAQQ
jgi:hypothetical protein